MLLSSVRCRVVKAAFLHLVTQVYLQAEGEQRTLEGSFCPSCWLQRHAQAGESLLPLSTARLV